MIEDYPLERLCVNLSGLTPDAVNDWVICHPKLRPPVAVFELDGFGFVRGERSCAITLAAFITGASSVSASVDRGGVLPP